MFIFIFKGLRVFFIKGVYGFKIIAFDLFASQAALRIMC